MTKKVTFSGQLLIFYMSQDVIIYTKGNLIQHNCMFSYTFTTTSQYFAQRYISANLPYDILQLWL